MQNNLSNIRKIYISETKNFASSTTNSFIDLMNRRRKDIITRFKKEVKRNDLAWKIAMAEFGIMNLQGRRANKLALEEMRLSVVNKIRLLSRSSPFIKYAVIDNDGTDLVTGKTLSRREFEKFKHVALFADGAFIDCRWFSDREYPIYVRYFPYFHWVFLTIVDLDAIDAKLKKEWVKMLADYRYGNNKEGYFIVYRLGGDKCKLKILVNSFNPSKIGKCVDFKRAFGRKLNRSFYISKGMFINIGKGKTARIVFLRYFRPWNWIVGSGIILNDVFKSINKEGLSTLKQMRANIRGLVVFLSGIGLFTVLLVIVFMEFSKRKTDRILLSLDKALKENRFFINEKPVFREFESIISYFSEALDKINTYENDFLKAFVSILEARDVYTKGHSQRVAFYSREIAKRLGYDNRCQEDIYRAGLLHDIGKVGIPDAVLLKPGRLTDNEYNIMKQHPIISYEILVRSSRFKHLALWVRQHHERCDGNGYPDGLVCKDISVEGKIIAVADVFDALTTTRPYRKAFNVNEAMEILKKEKLDKKIVRVAEDVLLDSIQKVDDVEVEFMSKELDRIRNELFNYDFVTGLKTWLAFRRSLKELVETRTPFVLYRIEIKNLSYINYKFGEIVGNEIVEKSANVLKDFSEKGKLFVDDMTCRAYGNVFFVARRKQGEELRTVFEEESSIMKNYLIRRVFSELVKDGVAKSLEESLDFYVCFALYPDDGESLEEVVYKSEYNCK